MAESNGAVATLRGHSTCVDSVCYHPTDRDLLASACNGNCGCRPLQHGSVKLRRKIGLTDEQLVATLKGHTHDVVSIAFHPTIPHIVGTASMDTTAKVWNYETQTCLATLEGHACAVESICFHPTIPHIVGTVGAAKSWDVNKGSAKVWNYETQECIATLKGHRCTQTEFIGGKSHRVPRDAEGSGCVRCLCFHPTIPQLVATGGEDGDGKLWNYETQQCIVTLKGRTYQVSSYHNVYTAKPEVNSICFHPTIPHLAATANAHTAQLWNVSKKISALAHAYEQAYSAAHPLTIKTLAGDTYTLEAWGSCKDLKVALCKVAGEPLGKPSRFELLGDPGPRPPSSSQRADVQIDGKYGSNDRRKMVAPSMGFNFELTLVYTFFEDAYSAAHPLTIKTLAGDTYTLKAWGSCKDLKVALCTVAGEQLGKPSSFELLGDFGPRAAAVEAAGAASEAAGANDGASGGEGGNNNAHVQIDGKYGSDDRKRMITPGTGFNFELTLVYTYLVRRPKGTKDPRP